MGWGDYIMASGHVRRIKINNPQIQVLIKSPFNTTQFYRDVFKNNPYITHENDLKKDRPLIRINRVEAGKVNKEKNRIIWNNERVSEVGDFYSSNQEVEFANKFLIQANKDWVSKNKKKPKAVIYISDTAKTTTTVKNEKTKKFNYSHYINKEWGKKKWSEFINMIEKDYLVIKSSPTNETNTINVYSAKCDFRSIKAIMDKSDFFIGNEGGLSHLWATTRKKGIVLFGHWIPPYLTGYSFHTNISANTNNHCGSLDICDDCQNFFKNLSPEFIKSNLDANI